jgi:glycerol-3-phosphate dehydrogenase
LSESLSDISASAKEGIKSHITLPSNIPSPPFGGQGGLVGGHNYTFSDWKNLQSTYAFSEATSQHLMKKYGNRAVLVAALTKENANWTQRLSPKYPYIAAEVIYQVRHEMAMTLRDVLARRMRLEILDWQATIEVIPTVSALMAQELGWSAAEKTQAEEEYLALIRRFVL